MQKTNRGFTLIELMVTIAILAIITTIAIPAYTGYVKTAKMTEATNNLAALRLAQEENFLENNVYFTGANTAAVETASNGLWEAAKGSNGAVNFNYVVTNAAGWTATATGTGNGVVGEIVTASK